MSATVVFRMDWEDVTSALEEEMFVYGAPVRKHDPMALRLVNRLEDLCREYREAEADYAAARRLVADDAAELARMRLEDAAASIVENAREATR